MIELPESLILAKQLNDAVLGRRVQRVLPPTKPHKFCWFQGDAAAYDGQLRGSAMTGASGFGIYVELAFDNGRRLCFNDGVNIRLMNAADAPKDYQLLIEFDDGVALCFTVAMYGSIILHAGGYDNEYYLKSRNAHSPFDQAFEPCYRKQLAESKNTLSMKAFLAAEQRFPGIGNGAAQDILFAAGLHPKRKLGTLTKDDQDRLLACIVSVLREMTDRGGRDTEKNLFGEPGGYQTKMSRNTLASGCPVCGGAVTKETYLGGSVYYCPHCQLLEGK